MNQNSKVKQNFVAFVTSHNQQLKKTEMLENVVTSQLNI